MKLLHAQYKLLIIYHLGLIYVVKVDMIQQNLLKIPAFQ